MSFNKQLGFMKLNNKGTKNVTSGTARAKVAVKNRRRRVQKTVVDSQPRRMDKFDKEMKEFFKNYKSPIGSESG